MKGLVKSIAMVAAILSASNIAKAEDVKSYVGLGVGSYSFDVDILGFKDSGSVTGAYGVLGYDANPYFGMELRMGATGEANVWGLKYSMSNFISYLVKLQYPASEEFRVYVLVGGTSGNLTTSGGASVSKTGLSYGGGAEFNVSENLSIGAEWVQYWDKVAMTPGVNTSLTGISGMFRYTY